MTWRTSLSVVRSSAGSAMRTQKEIDAAIEELTQYAVADAEDPS